MTADSAKLQAAELARVRRATAALRRAQAKVRQAQDERDAAVRAGLVAGVPRAELAEAAGLDGVRRLYQIRDGSR